MGPFGQKRNNSVFRFCRRILDIFRLTLLNNCHVKVNLHSIPKEEGQWPHGWCNGPLLGIIALILFYHSASPRLERTGYGTLAVAAEVASIGTLFIFSHPFPKHTLLKGPQSAKPCLFTYQSLTIIFFGACRSKGKRCETTKNERIYFKEHNLQ